MPRKAITFFIDRSLGSRLVPEALRALGASVELHKDHFAADAPDADWIAEVGRRGWAILTKDKWIRHRPLERRAVIATRGRLFALTTGNLSGEEIARVFAKHLQKMTDIARSERTPFIARMSRYGIVVEHPRH